MRLVKFSTGKWGVRKPGLLGWVYLDDLAAHHAGRGITPSWWPREYAVRHSQFETADAAREAAEAVKNVARFQVAEVFEVL